MTFKKYRDELVKLVDFTWEFVIKDSIIISIVIARFALFKLVK